MHKFVKQFVTKSAQHCGFTLVPNRLLDRLPQTRYLARLFSLLSVDCVFDVGANKGQYGRFLRDEVGYKGTIVSFEPVPASLELLRGTARGDSKWHIEPYALGAAAGKARFNIMAKTVFSSFLTPDHSRLSRFQSSNRVLQQIDVDVATLDAVFPEIVARTSCRVPYLKMDTQGFDLDVAAGGRAVIREFRALQSEASVTPIYEGMPDFTKTIDAFRTMGFDISAMFHLNPSGHFPRMIEFDCHMINCAYLPPDKPANH
jgi:FkbM family methyltransferase